MDWRTALNASREAVVLRHASIQTAVDVHVQRIDQNALEAVNSRTAAVLDGWKAPASEMELKGEESEVVFCNLAKEEGEVDVSA